MAKNECILVPTIDVGGEQQPSILYKDLQEKVGDRLIANFIYASYLQPGVAAMMNSRGYRTNNQGEHSAEDVYNYFEMTRFKNEVARIGEVERSKGIRDYQNNLIDFDDAEVATTKAEEINNNYKSMAAIVVQHGDKFNVLVSGRDSVTIERVVETKKRALVWDTLNEEFLERGFDLNDFKFNIQAINSTKGESLIQWFNNLSLTKNHLLGKPSIQTILKMLDSNNDDLIGRSNKQILTRLQEKFSTNGTLASLDTVAERVFEATHGGTGFNADTLTLINSALESGKEVLKEIPYESIRRRVRNSLANNTTLSEEAINDNSVNVLETIKELDRKFSINKKEIDATHNNIRSLSDALADAIFTLKRKMAALKDKEGVTDRVKELRDKMNLLQSELDGRKYLYGVTNFLNEALNEAGNIETIYRNALLTPGTKLEIVAARSSAILEIMDIMSGYKSIVDALSNMKSLAIDEAINEQDIKNVENLAKKVKEIFDNSKATIEDLKENTLIDLCIEYLGEKTYNGTAIADIVKMAKEDSSWLDKLYAGSSMSNPILAVVGTIIRDAQSKRNQELVQISMEIRRATNRLRKAGINNTDFIYEADGHIVSDIDWISYESKRQDAIKEFVKLGKKNIELAEAIEMWEEENTEERIVDPTNDRTERVPNSNYRKEFNLTGERLKYYRDMMRLKGRLGSMLPDYAQSQFLPPQKRRSFLDAIKASKGNPTKIAKAILNKLQELYKVREDDTTYNYNGIITEEGETLTRGRGSYDNTPIKRIPIFFVRNLEDPGELLKDFSGAMQAFASTAVNYKYMNEIVDTVEFVKDYVVNQNIGDRDRKGMSVAEVHDTKYTRLIKKLWSTEKATNTIGIIEGLIDAQIYGIKLKDSGNWTKAARSLLEYTSMRSLTVNLKGMIANYLVGEVQMLIEAGSSEFYDVADYAWANAKVFGDASIGAPGRIIDFFRDNVDNLPNLLAQRFEPLDDQYRELSEERYFTGRLRHMASKDWKFIGYGIGEYAIHMVTMYAVLHNIKVRINGKEKNGLLNYTLYDAFEKGEKIDGSSTLKLKDNVEYKDENGNWVAVDEAYLDKIKDRIRYCNHTTHGAMSEEDKGIIHRTMAGRFVMNLRQWMVGHYSRRFRYRHYEGSLKEDREGYWYTVGRVVWSWCQSMYHFQSEYATKYKDLTPDQRKNCRRAFWEFAILVASLALSFGMGEPEDHKKEFWYRMAMYQVRRLKMETIASMPGIMVMEIVNMLNNPIAATNTINSLLYIFAGLPDLAKEVKRGRYKGWNLYLANMYKYFIPFTNQIDQLMNMDEDDAIFAIFERKNMR